jgi:glutaredoxin-like YruB-family protein
MPTFIDKVKQALYLDEKTPDTPSVRIYTQPTCPACHSTKAYLDQKGVEYQDVDVTKDHEALHEMVRLSGIRATPVLVIGERVITGDTDPAAIDEALAAVGLP